MKIVTNFCTSLPKACPSKSPSSVICEKERGKKKRKNFRKWKKQSGPGIIPPLTILRKVLLYRDVEDL